MSIEQVAALLAKNNAAEQEAIDGYFELLKVIKEEQMPVELYRQIQEIISDEMQHSEVLSKWVTALSHIKPNIT